MAGLCCGAVHERALREEAARSPCSEDRSTCRGAICRARASLCCRAGARRRLRTRRSAGEGRLRFGNAVRSPLVPLQAKSHSRRPSTRHLIIPIDQWRAVKPNRRIRPNGARFRSSIDTKTKRCGLVRQRVVRGEARSSQAPRSRRAGRDPATHDCAGSPTGTRSAAVAWISPRSDPFGGHIVPRQFDPLRLGGA